MPTSLPRWLASPIRPFEISKLELIMDAKRPGRPLQGRWGQRWQTSMRTKAPKAPPTLPTPSPFSQSFNLYHRCGRDLFWLWFTMTSLIYLMIRFLIQSFKLSRNLPKDLQKLLWHQTLSPTNVPHPYNRPARLNALNLRFS